MLLAEDLLLLVTDDASGRLSVPEAQVDSPEDLMSRLIYRGRPDMVRGAWVRGRRLDA